MKLTTRIVCVGCGAPAMEAISEIGEVTYDATRRLRKAALREDGSIELIVDADVDRCDDLWHDGFDSHGFRCSRCDERSNDPLDIVQREAIPEVGDRFHLRRERRDGTVESVEQHRVGGTLYTYVVIGGEGYEFRPQDQDPELELLPPNPDQLALPVEDYATSA